MDTGFDFRRSYGWLALGTVPALVWCLHRLANREHSDTPVSSPRDRREMELPCELRLFRRSQRRALRVAEGLAALFAVAATGAVFYRAAGGSAAPELDLSWIIQVGLVAATSWFSLWVVLRSGIHLDRDWIQYRSGVPGPFQSLHPDWSAMLHEVDAVGFDRSWSGGPPAAWRMILRTSGGVRKIPAWGWVFELPDGAEVTIGAPQPWVSPQRYPSPEVLPLVRFFRERGLAVDLEPEAPQQADLFRATRARALLGAALVAMVYAAADGMVGTETYSDPATAVPVLAALGLLASLGAALWLRRGGGLSGTEGIAVSAVFGIAIAVAGYPGALRLNAWSDDETPAIYRYLHDGRDLVPLQPSAPALDFWFKGDYLAAFDGGTEHEIAVRRGGLGFLQIRKTELLRRLQACGGSCRGRAAPRPRSSNP